VIEPRSGRGGPQRIPRPDSATLGGPPPWNHTPEADRSIDLDVLRVRLAAHTPRFADRGLPARGRHSAVLIPLYVQRGEPMVLLTRRSPHMRSHTHEVSFPGGRHDEEDGDLVETALREAHEEVNLEPSAVHIVGELDRFVTGGSGSLVHPYVGMLERPPTNLAPNPAEVEAILHVRLNELLLDEVWREERWSREGGPAMPVTFFELHGDTVWGATGNMLRQLLTIATDPL
jgi:8-oxo-dGTP pyrophosphatase MutT (NUDIX family)